MKRYVVDDRTGTYAETQDGDWVMYRDVEQLLEQLEELRKLNQTLQRSNDRLRNQVKLS